jgi:hypothetical protein
MTKPNGSTRAETRAAQFATASDALRNAYRERRVTKTMAKLAAEAGYPFASAIYVALNDVWKATPTNLERIAKLAAALGVERGPFHVIVPDAVVAERIERERTNRLFPPSPKRPTKKAWDEWAARCREIAEREAAKRTAAGK